MKDLIKYFYADEHAAYCFLAQILDICQDKEHPLHTICNEVWNSKVENEMFQLGQGKLKVHIELRRPISHIYCKMQRIVILLPSWE